MIQTFKRKRIDILVDAPLCDWLIEQAGLKGALLHGMRVHSGLGRTGAWRDDDGYGAVPKRMFVVVTNEQKVEALIERIAPDIERYGLVITIFDVEVIRGERF